MTSTWQENKFGLGALGSWCIPVSGHPAGGGYNGQPATLKSGNRRGEEGQKREPPSEEDRKGAAGADEKQNSTRWTSEDPEEIVGLLVKGAEVGNAKGDFARECEDQGGRIKGFGPDCEPLEEEGEAATAECFYRETLECIKEHRFRVLLATEKYTQAMHFNTNRARNSYSCVYGNGGYVAANPKYCDMASIISRPGYDLENLEPYRDDMAFSEMLFQFCHEDVPNACECKRCLIDIPKEQEPDEEEDDSPDEPPTPEPEVPDEPTVSRKFKTISTSASTGPIPRVWGRYVVGGNIISLNKMETVLREVIEETNSGGAKTTNVFDTYVDFQLGLCRGQINALLRVWFDDMLILNRIVDPAKPEEAASDLDLSMYTRSDYDLTTIAARKPILELYEGTEYQKTAAEVSYAKGFGKAPAYRGLSILHFKNVNLAVLGGSFPKIRVDLVTEANEESYIFESVELPTTNLDYLSLNPLTGMAHTLTTGEQYKLYDWDTCGLIHDGNVENDTNFFLPLSSNHLLTIKNRDFAVIDPTFDDLEGRVTDTSPFGLTLNKNPYNTYLARNIRFFDTRLLKDFDLVVASLDDNRVGYVYYDYVNEKLYSNFISTTGEGVVDDGTLDSAPLIPEPEEEPIADPSEPPPPDPDFLDEDDIGAETPPPPTDLIDETGEGSGTPAEGFIPSSGGGFITPVGYRLPLSSAVFSPTEALLWQDALIYESNVIAYFQFFIPVSLQTELRIARSDIVTPGGKLNTILTPVVTTIPREQLWGTDVADVKLCNIVHSAADNSFILFFRCEGSNTYSIAKYSPKTASVVWRADCPYPFTSWSRSGDIASRSATQQYVFISGDGEIVNVDLSNGDITELSTLTTLTAPPYETLSGQYYDGRTNSLLYLSSSAGASRKLVRLFLQRLTPNRVSLGYILRDIANTSTRTKDIIDTTGIDGVTVDGFAALDSVSAAKFFGDLAEFYQLSVVDTGQVLAVVQKGSLSIATAIDSVDDIIAETERKQKTADTSLPDSVSVSFVSVGELGLQENLQTISIREQDGDIFKVPNTREFAITVNETTETMRQYAEQVLRAIRASQQMVTVDLMPRMLGLTVHDPVIYDGITYRIRSEYFSPENHTQITAEKFEYTDYDTQISVGTADLASTVNVSRSRKASLLRPRVLYCNAVNNEDAIRAASGTQIAYSLIEAATADIPPTSLALRVVEHTSTEMVRFSSTSSYLTRTIPPSDLYTSKQHTKAAHFGSLTVPPIDTVPAVTRTNLLDEMEVTFARQDTIDYLNTLTNYETEPWMVLEDSTKNLLIIGQELIQFGSFEIIEGRRVLFFNLYRGVRGTEMYSKHTANDRVYLYSPDTILPMPVNSEYTKRGAVGRVWVRAPRPAGYSAVEYTDFTDAGSARPWAPTHVSAYYVGGDRTRIRIKFKRRNPVLVDQLEENGGAVASTFGTSNFFILGTRIFRYEEPDLDRDMYRRKLLDVPHDLRYVNLPDDTVVANLEFNYQQSSSSIGFYPEMLLRVMICQYAVNKDGGIVMGHPLFYDIPSGYAELVTGDPAVDREGSFPRAP